MDRDYKAGDDLILVERLFENGHDAQLLHVFRRDEQDSVSSEVASTAAKWHGYAGSVEFELIAAKHYDAEFFGVSCRVPVGPAVLRSDIAMRRGIGQREKNELGDLGVYQHRSGLPLAIPPLLSPEILPFSDFRTTSAIWPFASGCPELQAGLSASISANARLRGVVAGFESHLC